MKGKLQAYYFYIDFSFDITIFVSDFRIKSFINFNIFIAKVSNCLGTRIEVLMNLVYYK